MPRSADPKLPAAIEALALRFKGPGGAVAVIENGETLVRHSWGYANVSTGVVMTPMTIMPICSITKQFTCGVLLETVQRFAELDGALAAYLPLLQGPRPSIEQLCHNQSGLRDYPPLSILCGMEAEGDFRPEHAKRLISSARSTHFPPGTQYSYANSNFHILSDLLEDRFDRPLGELIRERIFEPAGMATARYEPESRAYPAHCTGYEGSDATGFMPAIHRSHWTGDAGISASLDDMIAYERFIDRTRDDPNGLYRRLSAPQCFSEGKPAPYGFGLEHRSVAGTTVTGHAGGMRGWRLYRVHAPAERLSVVVMFNHEGDARGAANFVLAAALGRREQTASHDPGLAPWMENYVDDDTGLSVSLAATEAGLTARLLDTPEPFAMEPGGGGRSETLLLSRQGDGMRYQRPADNLALNMRGLRCDAARDIEGRFHCIEIDADLVLGAAGGAMFATFEGFLGRSVVQPLYPIGPDVWLLPTQRGIDVAPGHWTLLFRRSDDGLVTGFTIGCWLARGLRYERA